MNRKITTIEDANNIPIEDEQTKLERWTKWLQVLCNYYPGTLYNSIEVICNIIKFVVKKETIKKG